MSDRDRTDQIIRDSSVLQPGAFKAMREAGASGNQSLNTTMTSSSKAKVGTYPSSSSKVNTGVTNRFSTNTIQ